ncbi:hypothetical protein [Mycobacterium sp. IDR2000157661]|uniref:hypothetical protein n=1 Tax=Mycobacterium sp. IDR2000157661 TaxID=2867005 RepID=UPI001EECF19B|nr:hypothetical protein [Mycobacterium sp. IDR2000157661]ULE31880.1 hypothetical protein K3G64_17055 [Mycobacterium sp. IDR2000157661]
MDVDPGRPRGAAWRDPLSMGFTAHRQVLLLKLRWHERRQTRPASMRLRRHRVSPGQR